MYEPAPCCRCFIPRVGEATLSGTMKGNARNARRRPWCRPCFRWAGSKRSLLPSLLDCVPHSYDRYIEPFAGSACLFFALRPDRAILGDFNVELMQAYRTIAKHPRLIAREVLRLPASQAAYYRIRSLVPNLLTPLHRAVRFAYLNRYCFNGVYRTDRKNRFNVPQGAGFPA